MRARRTVRSPGDGAPAAPTPADELGAHVSTAGGVQNAPARAAEIGSRVLQLFTKQPSRWAEPVIDDAAARAFAAARRTHGIGAMAAHDAYLINLASPDDTLRARSFAAFREELVRCERLGVPFLVSHPGSATDGDRASAIDRNADELTRALESEPGHTIVLLETTAGCGSALGARLEELATLRARVGAGVRGRVGFCVDTCHVWAAGYDLRDDYAGVTATMDELLGREHVRLFHLNDSVGGLGSRRDRHAHIGAGALGERAFAALVRDARYADVPKLLETPKDGDAVSADRRNLALLRALRSAGTAAA